MRPPSTHNRLLLRSIDALGQLQRWKQCEWSDVRAIAPAPHLKEAMQAFLLRFQKQLVGKEPKGEKGGRAASDASRDPSLQSFSVWDWSWMKQRGYIENKGVFVQAEQGM